MIKKTFHLFHHHQVFWLSLIIVIFLTIIGLNPVDLDSVLSSRIGMASDYNNTATATISPNPYNTLALQLREKEALLNDRETLLAQKESDIQKGYSAQNKTILLMTIGIITLFCLVFINYYLDHKRRQKNAS